MAGAATIRGVFGGDDVDYLRGDVILPWRDDESRGAINLGTFLENHLGVVRLLVNLSQPQVFRMFVTG